MRGWWLVAGMLIACGDDSGSGNTSGPRCALDGERVTLPESSNFDVAAVADGWVVIEVGSDGVGAFHLANDGTLGARESVALPAFNNISATGANGIVYVTTPAQATFDGLRIAKREAGVWTTEREPDVAGNTTFDLGSSIAVSGNKVAVAWLTDEALYVTDYVDGVFTTSTVPSGGAPPLTGNEVEVTFAGDTLWVVAGGDDGVDFALYAYSRDASGTWSRAIDLGPVEGSLGNISIAGMATDDTGRPRLVVVEPSSFIDGKPGGARVIGVDDQSKGGGPSDDRPVTEGVDVEAMAGYGVLATASWGENNFDFAQSRDSMLLYSCIGTCRQVLTVDGTKGTFYSRAKLATSGLSGVVVYQREPKGGDGEEQLVAQRFTCEAPAP